MAISGVAASDVDNIAQFLGKSRKEIALELNNFSYLPKSCSAADHGAGTKQADLTMVNLNGLCFIDWGDGTVTQQKAATTTATHVYATTGVKNIRVTSHANTTTCAVTLA